MRAAMNRYLTFSLAVSMTLGTLSIPLRAAKKPRAGTDNQRPLVWTNDDLARLHSLGLISIVGQSNAAMSTSASVPEGCVKTQDPEWYAQQAAKLRDELQRDRKSTRLNSSHGYISYAVFCLTKKKLI